MNRPAPRPLLAEAFEDQLFERDLARARDTLARLAFGYEKRLTLHLRVEDGAATGEFVFPDGPRHALDYVAFVDGALLAGYRNGMRNPAVRFRLTRQISLRVGPAESARRARLASHEESGLRARSAKRRTNHDSELVAHANLDVATRRRRGGNAKAARG